MEDYITVKVTKVPGAMKEVSLESDNATVRDALNAADMAVETGYEIRVDGEVATEDTILSDGNIVAITKMIKGN